MTKAKARRSTTSSLSIEERGMTPRISAPESAIPAARPGGKLGTIVDHLASDAGATADELVEATGWKKNTVLGALSPLRTRGFTFQLETRSGRRAYRLGQTGA